MCVHSHAQFRLILLLFACRCSEGVQTNNFSSHIRHHVYMLLSQSVCCASIVSWQLLGRLASGPKPAACTPDKVRQAHGCI